MALSSKLSVKADKGGERSKDYVVMTTIVAKPNNESRVVSRESNKRKGRQELQIDSA